MNFHRASSLVAAAILLLIGSTAANAASPIAVGQVAPKFALKNQAGSETSLAELVKQKPVALIFYRSADW